MVTDLKESNPKQWYSKVKRMSSIDKSQKNETTIESFSDITDEVQVEMIADSFEKISKQYDPLSADSFPSGIMESSKTFPKLEQFQVYQVIMSMKTKASTITGDIPMKIIKEFGTELAPPLTDIINRSTEFSPGFYHRVP